MVNEASVLRAQELRRPGRPLSARSAWAVIAVSEGQEAPAAARAGSLRARRRWERLVERAAVRSRDQDAVHDLAVTLRWMLRNRARRCLYRAAPADLADVRADDRWSALVESAATGIASGDVEGYLPESDVAGVVKDFLLVEGAGDANVVVHVIPSEQHPFPDSKLRLAADLVEHRRPREEARAAELLHELAAGWGAHDR